jgi:hypothetical protein
MKTKNNVVVTVEDFTKMTSSEICKIMNKNKSYAITGDELKEEVSIIDIVLHRNRRVTKLENYSSSDILEIQILINDIEFKKMLPSIDIYSNRVRISTRFGEYDNFVYFKKNCLVKALKNAHKEFIIWYEKKTKK